MCGGSALGKNRRRGASLFPLLLTALVLPGLVSCGTFEKPAAAYSPAPPARLNPLFAANPAPRSVRLSGMAEGGVGGGKAVSASSAVAAPPLRLRLTLTGPLGTAWFLAVVNAETVFYAIPSQGVVRQYSRTEGEGRELPGLGVWPEDMAAHLYPSFTPELAGNNPREKGEAVVAEYGKGRRVWEFYPDGRMKRLTIIRPGGKDAVFTYRYPSVGGYAVSVNGKVEFRFDTVELNPVLPDGAFDPPGSD